MRGSLRKFPIMNATCKEGNLPRLCLLYINAFKITMRFTRTPAQKSFIKLLNVYRKSGTLAHSVGSYFHLKMQTRSQSKTVSNINLTWLTVNSTPKQAMKNSKTYSSKSIDAYNFSFDPIKMVTKWCATCYYTSSNQRSQNNSIKFKDEYCLRIFDRFVWVWIRFDNDIKRY